MKKVIFSILIISCIFLPSIGTAQTKDNPPPPQPGPEEKRPADCVSKNEIQQCVTASADGYTLYFWYKPGTEPGSEKFEYTGISHNIGMGLTHIYKSLDRISPQVYIVVYYYHMTKKDSNGLTMSEYTKSFHYITGDNVQWDKNPDSSPYTIKGFYDPGLVTGLNRFKARYSFRVVINGNIEFENTSGTTPANGAQVQMRITGDKCSGPPMEDVKTDDKGFFEFSRDGLNEEEVWLNINNVPKVILQIQYESGGLKYEKFVDYSYPTQFISEHPNDKVKALLGERIKIAPADNVTDFCSPIGTKQGLITELTGGIPDWKDAVIKTVVCWLRNGVLKFFYFEANLAGYFLRRNY